MATTQEMLADEQNQFAASFDEDFSRTEPSEDESFGLNVEAAAAADEGAAAEGAEGAKGDDAAVVVAVVDGEALEEQAGDAMAEQSAEAAAETASQESQAEAEEEPTDPKEIQRKKSWEGRLRAREEELRRREEELKAMSTKPSAPADEAAAPAGEEGEAAASAEAEATAEALDEVAESAADPGVAQRADELKEAVEDGSITPEEAMQRLSEDFGDEFVQMIRAIAGAEGKSAASREAASLRSDVEGVINTITDVRAREHFESIAEVHPDFNDIGKSEEFKAWAAEDPAREQIASGGSARQIVRLLNEYKAAAPAAAAPAAEAAPADEMVAATGDDDNDTTGADDDALEAAEAVRSSGGGMRLPDEPVQTDNFEEAWNQF